MTLSLHSALPLPPLRNTAPPPLALPPDFVVVTIAKGCCCYSIFLWWPNLLLVAQLALHGRHLKKLCFTLAAANGVVIATEKTLPSILVEEASVQKIQLLTPNIGVV
ncbi:uncharacterized protein [Arachis hypogaea]|uniref:uncharacterized protein isoform X2 n=1 Tax=Arachis hypogaea TaxID=3818 RepID=UPI000DED39C4|nr:probable proteasome subunit alpha type-2 isoform X2 [Arachis hypogaea]